MKLTTIIETLTAWLTSVQETAIKRLRPLSRETGRQIGAAVREELQAGYIEGLMDGPAFAASVIEVEPIEVASKRIEGPAKKRKVRGK